MKNLIVLLIVSSFIIVFTSCQSQSGKRVPASKSAQKAQVDAMKTDSVVFSPENIAVTEVEFKFIPYPDFDGGAGLEVSYVIGLQYKGKIYEAETKLRKFFPKNITEDVAKKDSEVSQAILQNYLAGNTSKDYVDVLLLHGEVKKITRRATFFPDGRFCPTELIWEK